jgi:hypothetical protein
VRCFPVYYGQMLGAGAVPNASKDAFLRTQLIEVFFPDIYGTSGTECTETPPPPPNKVGSSGYQTPNYPGPGCAYPNEIQQAHTALVSPPLVTITFPPPAAAPWYTKLPLAGTVQASSSIGQAITALDCTGAGVGSGAAGFAVHVKKQGGPTLLTCTATDLAGNQGEAIRALWVDDTPPVTLASISRLRNGAASVTLAATDNVSGVSLTQFRVNGGAWTTGNFIFFGSNGTYVIEYRSTDVAGNMEKTKSTSVTVTITQPCPKTGCGP